MIETYVSWFFILNENNEVLRLNIGWIVLFCIAFVALIFSGGVAGNDLDDLIMPVTVTSLLVLAAHSLVLLILVYVGFWMLFAIAVSFVIVPLAHWLGKTIRSAYYRRQG
jgi:hypothetical protein